MTALWCKRCGSFHDSSAACRERRTGGRSGPTTLAGAIFQGVFGGIMAGFPFGQLTNRPEPFLAVALSVLVLRVGYHVAKHWQPRKRSSAPPGPQPQPRPQEPRTGTPSRDPTRWVWRVALALGGLAAAIVLAVWWSHRPPPLTLQERLALAVEGAGAAEVQGLLEDGASPAGVVHDAFPPLYTAARRGSVELTRLLLDRGADVNQRASGQETALHTAVTNRRLEVVQLLLERGADPSLASLQGLTPLALAARKGADLRIAKALVGVSPLDWGALYVAPPEVLTLLLEASATSEAVSPDGRHSLLSWAARRGNLAGVLSLLSRGAPVDQAPPSGTRPLLEALTQGHQEVAVLLLERGAAPDPLSDGEAPPLELAVAAGLPATVQRLLERGAQARLCPKLQGATVEMILERAGEAQRTRKPAGAP